MLAEALPDDFDRIAALEVFADFQNSETHVQILIERRDETPDLLNILLEIRPKEPQSFIHADHSLGHLADVPPRRFDQDVGMTSPLVNLLEAPRGLLAEILELLPKTLILLRSLFAKTLNLLRGLSTKILELLRGLLAKILELLRGLLAKSLHLLRGLAEALVEVGN